MDWNGICDQTGLVKATTAAAVYTEGHEHRAICQQAAPHDASLVYVT